MDEESSIQRVDAGPLNGTRKYLERLQPDKFILLGYGPDKRRSSPPGFGYPFATPNGLAGAGDIWLGGGRKNEV